MRMKNQFPSIKIDQKNYWSSIFAEVSETEKIIGIAWVVAEIFKTENSVFFNQKKTVFMKIARTPLTLRCRMVHIWTMNFEEL